MKTTLVRGAVAICTALCVLFTQVTPCPADMDSFLDQVQAQMSSLSPQAYQGQERGYYMGGSMSVRIPNETIQPFTLSIPRISAGCGGIDIVTGGFSYLGFQYLVDKLQNILSAAPAFAFQIALGALCPDCKNVLDSLEMISDMVNSLNLNSCNAAKAIGGFAGYELARVVTDRTSRGTEPSFFASMRSSLNSFKSTYDEFIRNASGVDSCYSLGTWAAIDQCLRTQGSLSLRVPVIEQAFSRTNTYKDVKEVIRAYVGDVYLTVRGTGQAGADGAKVKWVERCAGAAGSSLSEALVLGNYWWKGMTELTDGSWTENACQQQVSVGILQRVRTILTTLLASVRNGTPVSGLTNDELAIINLSPIPVWKYLSTAVLVERLGGDTAGFLGEGFVDNVSIPLAYEMSYRLLESVSAYVSNLIQSAKASSAEGWQENLMLIEGLQTFLRNEAEDGQLRAQVEWKAVGLRMGELYENYLHMTEYVHQRLAESKLLNSYLWAKGIR